MPVYEYLILVYLYRTNGAKIRSEISRLPRPKQTWNYEYYIYRPDSTEPEERPGETLLATLFNEFGKDGWRLVATDVPDSVVVSGDYYSWDEAGVPIRQRWTFMREVSS
jgi:hypothetical protein